MKRGTTAVSKLYRGTTAINKIMRGTTLIWESWVYYTGNLVNMTSNSAPSPFSAAYDGHGVASQVYYAFDSSDSTGIIGGSNHAYDGSSQCYLYFGSTIKVQAFSFITDTAVYYTSSTNFRKLEVAFRVGGSWVANTVFQNNSTSGSSTITPVECDAVRVSIVSSPNKQFTLRSFKITQWYAKG